MGDKAKPMNENRRNGTIDDIDFLVEEELSRKSEQEDDLESTTTMKIEISSKKADPKRLPTPNAVPEVAASSSKSPMEDNLSGSGNESSMFKELFTTANKSKGIAGMTFETKEEEVDDKQLNKQRSKKDLKNKFQSSAAAVDFDDKENKGNSIDESEVEEIIKQHLMEEEGTKKKKKKKEKAKPEVADDDSGTDDDSDQMDDETEKKRDEDEDSDGYDYMDDSLNMNVKSPKQTLIEHLRLLSDIFNSSIDGASDYYEQIFDERA